MIERIKRCSNLNKIILATSTNEEDDILESIAQRENILCYRGSLNNLCLRFFDAAKYHKIDEIVRITGDDILRDEIMIDKAIKSHLYNSCNVTMMKNMPYGTATEIINIEVLETILNTVNTSDNTEYLEYFLENDRNFSVNYVESDYIFDPSLRLTLDYMEDFQLFKKIFEEFYNKNPLFNLYDTLEWFKEDSSIFNINKNKNVKYKSDDIDVTLNI